MATRGTVWDYKYYEDGEEKTLRLVYNLRALKIYYNFFGSDLMADFTKSAFGARNVLSALPKEIREKISKGEEPTAEDLMELSDETITALLENTSASNSEFTINATIALVAAGEDTLRSADEIESELPPTVIEEEYRKNLIEFITFCKENAKKNKVIPVWVAA